MNAPCEQVELFFDQELPEAERQPFIDHLVDCAGCQARLTGLMQLDALGADYAERLRARIGCADVARYLRCEMEVAEEHLFQQHLAGCRTCLDSVKRQLQVDGLLITDAGPTRRPVRDELLPLLVTAALGLIIGGLLGLLSSAGVLR